MPLLKADAFGNIYEVGFGNSARKAEVTYEEDNVMFGERTKKENAARAAAARKAAITKRNRETAFRVKQHTHAKKVAAQKEKQRIMNVSRIEAQNEIRAKQSAQYLQKVRDGKNPFRGQFSQATRGDQLVGFKTQGQVVSRKNMGKGHLVGVNNTQANGNTALQFSPADTWLPKSKYAVRKIVKRNQYFGAYEHPMAGMNAGFYGAESPMGFKIKMPKIKIKVPSIKKIVKDVGKVAGKVVNAPLDLTHKVMTTVPGVKDVHKGLDKLTGGTLSSLHRTVTLPGRALQTGKVSKAELLEAVVNVVKVGAIVVSGGSAVALIGAASGALKQGPLGKTSLGNTLLSIGEVAGLAYGAGQGMSKALEKKAIDIAAEKAGSEVGKKAGPLGAIAASVAVQAGAAGAGAGKAGAPKLDKIPASATTTAASQVTAVADTAAKNAAAELAKSGMKFSTEAAMAEAKKLVVEQAKGIVAEEFKKKTGIPLDIATKVASGKIPTAADIKEQMKKEMIAAPDKLKTMLADIPKQMKNADQTMAKILAERQKVLTAEVIKRTSDIAKVQEMGAAELVNHNLKFKPKAEAYYAEILDMEKISKEAKALRDKANNAHTNFADKEKFAKQANTLEEELMRRKNKLEPLGTEVADMMMKSEVIKEDNAARLAIAEFGGKTKFTGGSNLASDGDLRHPMLAYGLLDKKEV